MRSMLALTALLALMIAPAVSAQQYECTGATLVLGVDGSLNATLTLAVDGGGPVNLSVPTIGTPVYAEARTPDGVILAVSLGDEWVNVSVPPGVDRVVLSYITLDATSKSGEKWTLEYTLDCESRLILPRGAIPAGFQPDPRIVVDNGSVVFVFSPGTVRVEYFLQPGQPQGPGGPGGQEEQAPANGTNETTGPGQVEGNGIGLTTAAAAIAALAVASAAAYYLSRRPGHPPSPVPVEAEGLDERDERILEALRQSPGGLTASELMEATGIPKTPLYRRLNKLARRGLIEAVDEGGVRRYRIKS